MPSYPLTERQRYEHKVVRCHPAVIAKHIQEQQGERWQVAGLAIQELDKEPWAIIIFKRPDLS